MMNELNEFLNVSAQLSFGSFNFGGSVEGVSTYRHDGFVRDIFVICHAVTDVGTDGGVKQQGFLADNANL